MTSAGRSHVGRMRTPSMSATGVGVVIIVAIVLMAVVSFQKQRIGTLVSGGEEIQAEFSRQYKLKPYSSTVKIAGVDVGTVTDVEATENGSAIVTMKVDDEVKERLGSEPSATIRPTLVVGGRYYVELSRGGLDEEFAGDSIPVERTHVPVELDQVLSAVTPEASKGLRSLVGQTDASFRQGGRREIKRVFRNAPGALKPLGQVADALRGTRPATDLPTLVRSLDVSATTLTRKQGQLESIFSSFNRSTAALAAASPEVGQAIDEGPETLRVTSAGLRDLQTSLDKVTATAEGLRPSARELAPVLEKLDPVLVRTRPLLEDLRVVLEDARPAMAHLSPVVGNATRMFKDVRGPVMERVNGDFADMVLSPWSGDGPYENGGNSHKFYEELGYLTVAGARVFQSHDFNGSQGRLMAGVGGRTLGGAAFPKSVEQYLEDIFGMHMPPGPQEGKEPGGDGQKSIIELPEGGTP